MATHAIDFEKSASSAGPVRAGLQAHGVDAFLDPEQVRPVEYTVYLHTISKRDFNQPHALYGNVIVPACPKDKRYITFMKINHPVQQPIVDPDNPSGPNIIKIDNAKRVALGVCNPSFVGVDLSVQDKEVPDYANIASGECNLTRQGVFATLTPEPTEQDLKKAEARRLAYYKFRFEEANGIERSNPAKLQEVLILDHHMAAETFGVDVNWHRVVSPKIECVKCGEKIKEGIAYHFINGRICVLNWEEAVKAGAVKREEVPEEMRWWHEKPKRQTGISAAAGAFSDSAKEV